MKIKHFIKNVAPLLKKYVGDNVPNVNRGGCGIVAIALSAALDGLNIKHTIVVFGNMWSHVAIMVNGVYIDADGILGNNIYQAVANAKRLYGYYGDCGIVWEVWPVQLVAKVKSGEWNPDYDRKYMDATLSLVQQTVDAAVAITNNERMPKPIRVDNMLRSERGNVTRVINYS